jgi:phage N-6-adenine-methyltransferase
MTGLSIFTPGGELIHYRPERGLKAIAVAEAAEKHFARAKNPEKLYEAVKAKLTEQRKYALWRETVRPHGYGPGRGKKESTDRYSLLPKTDPGAHVARRWRIRLGTDEAFAVALHAAQVACLRICERRGGVKPYTGDDEWYTPARHIDRVRRVLGSIDLDPASNLEAQKVVKAKRFFTKADDALTHPWHGRVWLNPPYSRGVLLNFVSKLLSEIKIKNTTAAIVLLNNFTDASWFHLACSACTAICFPRGRISFKNATLGEVNHPMNGQVFLYYGDDVESFRSEFSEIGCGFLGAGSWSLVDACQGPGSPVQRVTAVGRPGRKVGPSTHPRAS